MRDRKRLDKNNTKGTKKLSEGITKKLEEADKLIIQAKAAANSEKSNELLNAALKLYTNSITEM